MKKILLVLIVFCGVSGIAQNLVPKQYESGKWGFVDSASGRWVITPRFDKVAIFQEGLAGVRYAMKCGFINKKGDIVISCLWENCYPFLYDYAIVENEYGLCGVIDKKGKLVIPCQYDWLGNFNGYNYEYD